MESMKQPDIDSFVNNLRKLEILQGINDDLLVELGQSAIWREYSPGAIVFLEGESNAALYYLHAGWLKLTKSSPDGREQTIRFLGPGETFNGISVFGSQPNPVTAITLEQTALWLIPRSSMHILVTKYPAVALRIIGNMAERLSELTTLVAELSLSTVEARLAKLLLSESTDNLMRRHRWATQAELAARLGTVPDVLSRVFQSLSKGGVISINRNEIHILDRPTLEAIAASEK